MIDKTHSIPNPKFLNIDQENKAARIKTKSEITRVRTRVREWGAHLSEVLA